MASVGLTLALPAPAVNSNQAPRPFFSKHFLDELLPSISVSRASLFTAEEHGKSFADHCLHSHAKNYPTSYLLSPSPIARIGLCGAFASMQAHAAIPCLYIFATCA